MSISQLASKYELVFIVDGKLPNDAKESVRKDVAEAVNKYGGKVINSQVWIERHKFTFRIKKCTEGTYYLMNIEGDNEIVEKVKSGLTLNEKVLRFMFIKVEAKAAAKV